MSSPTIPGLSSTQQMEELQKFVNAYWLLPEMFRSPYISGAFVERALAEVRGGKALPTYDFIDVLCDDGKTGFQVKATKGTTTITWMRAKIHHKQALIAASQRASEPEHSEGLQALGDAIIDFANEKISKSFRAYKKVENIHYARLKLLSGGRVEYTEAPLCTREKPVLFKKEDFTWAWRQERASETQSLEMEDPLETTDIENAPQDIDEVISSLQGTHIPTKERWWAWHGKSDNQLHFPGESKWLELIFAEHGLKKEDHQRIYTLPTTSLTSHTLIERLESKNAESS